MISLVDHRDALARQPRLPGEDRAEQSRADHEIVHPLSLLEQCAVLLQLAAVGIHTVRPVHIGVAHRIRIALHQHLAVLQPQNMVAQILDRLDIVRHIQKRRTARQHMAHSLIAAFAEIRVTNRQHLVADQDIRIHHGRHGKAKPRLHTGRIILDRRIQEVFQLRELHDLVKMLFHEFS